MSRYPTPHIHAEPAQIAPTVLMPGDPLRARFIAEHYLTDAALFNNVRGVQGYTGRYRGHRVSVMASGMGMPSMGIYSWELFDIFGVQRIIRIGSAGALQPDVPLRSLVFAMGACTTSRFAAQYHLPGDFAPIADYALLTMAVNVAQQRNAPFRVGNLLSADTFYNDNPADTMKWAKMGVLAVEMEAAALYMTAARAGKAALALCTISDHLCTGEATSAQEREQSFTQMMEVALETALQFD